MFFQNVLLASALTLGAIAAPQPHKNHAGLLNTAKLVAIAPATASCDGSEFPTECADATKAAAAINQSFSKYNITSVGERAALVAYMLFESGDFKYSHNHFPAPGRPGQGTRIMAMPAIIAEYATAVVGAHAVTAAQAQGPDAVLALVNSDDNKSFGTAAWFLTTKCTADVRAGLVAETTDGWYNFLTECVQTTLDPARDVPWTTAKQIMHE
ncbi:hypothetical protein ACEQ8H_005158 [Pleosporales sp. CAS-2024a]